MTTDIPLKNYVRFFSLSSYYPVFLNILQETYSKPIYHINQNIFSHYSHFKRQRIKPKNYWNKINKALFAINKKLNIPDLAVKYLTLQVVFLMKKLLKIGINTKRSLSDILELYIKQNNIELELAKSTNCFRNIVRRPMRVTTKKLSRHLMENLWVKARNRQLKENEENDLNDTDVDKNEWKKRYQVITPFIRPSNDNPIDSDALIKRLVDNFELFKFKTSKFNNRSQHKHHNNHHTPLKIKKCIDKQVDFQNRSANLKYNQYSDQMQKRMVVKINLNKSLFKNSIGLSFRQKQKKAENNSTLFSINSLFGNNMFTSFNTDINLYRNSSSIYQASTSFMSNNRNNLLNNNNSSGYSLQNKHNNRNKNIQKKLNQNSNSSLKRSQSNLFPCNSMQFTLKNYFSYKDLYY